MNNALFKDAYNTLNANQKLAVDTIEGPVMVVAGPGTGKTQTIALRVANILQTTQMRPSNILCLTFSTSGVKAMRERLRTFIGPDAYGVTVQTIHGFCNEVVQQNPDVFADWNTLEQVTVIEQLRMVRKAIADLPVGSQLRKPRLDKDRASAVLARINDMKQENMRPNQLKAVVPEYAESIETTPTGKARSKESAAYTIDQKKVEQFTEFIAVYESYQAQMQASQRYDFTDMILTCIDVLKTHDWLLAPLQEQYQYILVDEFQDLNRSQFAVLELLINYVHTDQLPNIFCVGDDDQAIYRFQGASIGNMQRFMKLFAQTAIINLTDNYRSTQPVLRASHEVIQYNAERMLDANGEQKPMLTSHSTKKALALAFKRYPSTELQFGAIAQYLHDLHATGIEWSNMAVICRRNAGVLQAAELLQTKDIPCDIRAKRNLLDVTEILQTISMLRAIVNPFDSVILSNALSAELAQIPAVDIAQVYLAWSKHKYEIPEGSTPSTLLEFILNADNDSWIAVKTLATQIWDWHSNLINTTVPDTIEAVLLHTGLIKIEGNEPVNPHVLASVTAFYEFVKSRCYEQKNTSLALIIKDIDEYISEPGLTLQYDIPHLVADGVQLMTAHGAKGLEFSAVVIPNTWSGNWGNRRSQTDLSLPEHLIFKDIEVHNKQLQQEDERRLFYVAMTRAEQHLLITFPETYRSGDQLKDAEVSQFIAEVGDAIEEEVVEKSQLPEPAIALPTPQIVIDTAFNAMLLEAIENFELSVTALNTFLDDPQRFLWEQLLKKPRAKQANLAYGTAVHFSLEVYAHAKKNGKPCSEQDLITAFEKYITTRELMTSADREEYLHLGRNVIANYATSILQEQPIVLYSERQFKARLGDIPIKGKVDRIDALEPNGKAVRIIDYKTGTVYKTEDAVRKKKDLYRQLVFYKLLADNSDAFMYTAERFCLDFIGNADDSRRVIDIAVTQADAEQLAEVITKVWQKILNVDFTPLE